MNNSSIILDTVKHLYGGVITVIPTRLLELIEACLSEYIKKIRGLVSPMLGGKGLNNAAKVHDTTKVTWETRENVSRHKIYDFLYLTMLDYITATIGPTKIYRNENSVTVWAIERPQVLYLARHLCLEAHRCSTGWLPRCRVLRLCSLLYTHY